jgi:hypothetical protein
LTGTLLHGPGADDESAIANIGFAFFFYGTAYTQAHVATNGVITFGGPNTSFVNQNLSVAAQPNPTIAVMWDDWVAGEVRSQTQGAPGSREFIVQWSGMLWFGTSDPAAARFQAILSEATGNILMNYMAVYTGDASFAGGSATLGIANVGAPANGQFLQWSHNLPTLRPGYAIEYSPGATSAAPVPEPASFLLLGAGLAAVAVRLRRRSQ